MSFRVRITEKSGEKVLKWSCCRFQIFHVTEPANTPLSHPNPNFPFLILISFVSSFNSKWRNETNSLEKFGNLPHTNLENINWLQSSFAIEHARKSFFWVDFSLEDGGRQQERMEMDFVFKFIYFVWIEDGSECEGPLVDQKWFQQTLKWIYSRWCWKREEVLLSIKLTICEISWSLNNYEVCLWLGLREMRSKIVCGVNFVYKYSAALLYLGRFILF